MLIAGVFLNGAVAFPGWERPGYTPDRSFVVADSSAPPKAVPLNYTLKWTAPGPAMVLAADLDDDGKAELVAADAHSLRAYAHDGQLAWENATFAGRGLHLVEDVDGDGEPEVVLTRAAHDGNGTDLVIEFVGPTGRLENEVSLRVDSQPADSGARVDALTDFDRDGGRDLVVALLSGFSLAPRGAVSLDLASGARTYFDYAPQLHRPLPVADPDHNGIQDVFLAGYTPANGYGAPAPGGGLSSHDSVASLKLWNPVEGEWWSYFFKNADGSYVQGGVEVAPTDLDALGPTDMLALVSKNAAWRGNATLHLFSNLSSTPTSFLDGPPDGAWAGYVIDDLHDDGTKQIIVGGDDQKLREFDPHLRLLKTKEGLGKVWASADVDGKRGRELLVSDTVSGSLAILDADLDLLWASTPMPLLDARETGAQVILADLGGDASLEVVVSSDRIYVWERNENVPPIPVLLPPACVELECSFDASGAYDRDGTIVDYGWDFGDGTSPGHGRHTTHRYASEGDYVVTLTVTDNQGVSASFSTLVKVHPPVARFGPLRCAQLPCLLDASASTASNGPIQEYTWTLLPENATLHGVRVSLPALNPGHKVVTLKVKDSQGAIATTTQDVYVNSPPVAQIIQRGQCVEGRCVLDGSTSFDQEGPILRYVWEFGDGSPHEFASSVVHTFPVGKDHTVTLTVLDGDSALSAPSRIHLRTPHAPHAGFEARCVSRVCTFRAVDAQDADADIVHYVWSFSDGTTLQETQPTATKAFATPGRYEVRAEVVDAEGLKSTANLVIVPNEPPVAIVAPMGCAGLQCTLDASASTDDGRIVSYLWDLDDGTKVPERNATVTFPSPGRKEVRLRVTDDLGASSVATASVQLPPQASFRVNLTPCTRECRFDASGTLFGDDATALRRFIWNFGDGTQHETESPFVTHRFPKPGAYNVTLAAREGNGTGPPAALIVPVIEPLQATIHAACRELNCTLTAPPAEGVEYAWAVENRTLHGNPQVHRFSTAGDHDVSLTLRLPWADFSVTAEGVARPRHAANPRLDASSCTGDVCIVKIVRPPNEEDVSVLNWSIPGSAQEHPGEFQVPIEPGTNLSQVLVRIRTPHSERTLRFEPEALEAVGRTSVPTATTSTPLGWAYVFLALAGAAGVRRRGR